MQITEQLIERIARRVFNAMFAPALRQSNVQGGGTPTSVRYAEEAGHATSADSADAVPWAGVTGKPNFATVATSGSYNDLSNKPSIPSVSGSVSGSTLTITINGSSYSLTDTNTWRPVQNTLDSTATGDSLSAYQGYLLARGSARDDSKLPLAGGTMTGDIKIGNSTFYASGTNGGINSLAVADDCILGDCNIGGHLGLKSLNSNAAGISFYNSNGTQIGQLSAYNGNIGIGTYSPSYKLHVAGTIYCTGGFTFLSDIRKKDVKTYKWSPTLDMIADAPIIRYTMKDDETHRMRVGSVAQYWQKVMPETVTETDDTLSMDGTTIALTSVIALAREVKQQKVKIDRLIQQIYG